VFKHWPVNLIEDVAPNMDSLLWVHAKNVRIECRVVNPTESETVRNFGQASLISIGKDMRGVQQLPMTQRAYAASALVRADNKFAKAPLV
jgi:hypothetical protein